MPICVSEVISFAYSFHFAKIFLAKAHPTPRGRDEEVQKYSNCRLLQKTILHMLLLANIDQVDRTSVKELTKARVLFQRKAFVWFVGGIYRLHSPIPFQEHIQLVMRRNLSLVLAQLCPFWE